MDRSRHSFLHSPHGGHHPHHDHHQRALLYHPRPRPQLTMPPHPMYDNLLSPPVHHYPRPYLDEFSPPFLPGPNPGSYGLMGGSYPIDFGYGFPGGLPLPIPTLPPHNAYMSMRNPQNDYQYHIDALQDHVNSFLRMTNPPESTGRPIPQPRNQVPDWMGAEMSLRGPNGEASTTPRLPRLHSPHRRGSLPSWRSNLTPPPLHLPPVKQSGLGNPPPLHSEHVDANGTMRKATADPEKSSHNGISPDELLNCLARMPKLPPLVIGNKDLAKKLEGTAKGVLNLSSSAEKSTTIAKRRLASNSPARSRNRIDYGAWEQSGDGRDGCFTAKRSPSRKTGLQRDGRFVKDLDSAEHSSHRGFPHHIEHHHHPQDLRIIPESIRSTATAFLPPQPYGSSCLTDVEAMQNAYIAANTARDESLPTSVGCSASDSSPTVFPPPLGFRGRRSFGGKRKRIVSPPGVRRSSVFSPQAVSSYRAECGRDWEWYGGDESAKYGMPGKGFMANVENGSGEDIYHREHIAVPSDMIGEEETGVTESGLIRVKEEPVDTDPVDPFIHVNNDFENGNAEQSSALGVDPGKYDLEAEEDDTDGGFLNVPFVDSSGGLLSPSELDLSGSSASRFRLSSAPASACVEKRDTGGAGDEGGTFRCHLCNYHGRSQHCLNKHFRAHGQAYKICRYCLKAFERPSDLVRHEERHQKRNHSLVTTASERPARFLASSGKLARVASSAGKLARKRHAWSCRQCHFTCREARRLIQHTRHAHPIFVECSVCRMKFVSEAELATHRTRRHPVAVGRLDSYCRGVLTTTKLVTCEVTGDQEISVDLAEISELPPDCSGIPIVSNVREVQSILEKDEGSVEDLGCISPSDRASRVGKSPSPIRPTGTYHLPRSFPLPLGGHPRPKAKSKNRPNSINIKSHEVVQCASALTSVPTSLTEPNTDDVSIDMCNYRPPISVHLDDVHREKLKFSPKLRCEDANKLVEKTPIALLKDAQVSRESSGTSISAPIKNSSHNFSLSETPRKFSTASHRKPSLLSNLLAKKPVKSNSVHQPAALVNRKVSEPFKKEFSDSVCALNDSEETSTNLDSDRNCVVESEPVSTETIVPEVTISKTEPADLCADDKTTSDKTEISTSEKETNSWKVFAECNGVEKRPEMYVCVRCKYSTNAKFKYQQHLKAHSGRFICKRCNKACIKSSDLYRHWVTHNVKGPDGYFACDSCDFTSPQKYVVEEHMKRHYTLHPQQPQRLQSAMSRCGLCQKNILRSRLFEHKRAVHGRFFPKSSAEPGKMETDANGNSVKSSLKVFACPQCDRKFTTPSYLLRHHFVHHQPSDGTAKAEENSCSCRFCGVKFEDVDHLQEHEINHILQTCTDADYVERCRKRKKRSSVEQKRSFPHVPLATKSPKSSFSSPPAVISTKSSPHRHRLSCPRCKKPFKLQYFLDQHMRIHSGERPYICQQCGAGFAIFQLLNIHRRFKCPHRKTLPLTKKQPLLNSLSLNSQGESSGSPASGSKCDLLNSADSVEKTDCLNGAVVRTKVEVSG